MELFRTSASVAILFCSALTAIGPIPYLVYLLLILPVRRIRLRRIWHLVPAFIILCLDIYLQTKPYTLKQQVLDAIFHSTGFHFLLLIQYIGGAIFCTSKILLLVVAISLLNKNDIRNALHFV